MKLSRAMENTILHWGEMGSRWGVNRSIAQIHALLYLSTTPLTADEIAETLGIARSNVSTSLRELQSWDLISMTHVLGDRRDHFEAKTDLWEVLITIVDERKRREIDPTVSTLRKCVLDADDDDTPEEVKKRLNAMLQFVETLTIWYDQISRLPKVTLIKLMRMGAKVANFVKT